MKNAAANDKLKKMVKDQQEAEKKKVKIFVKSLCVVNIFIYETACRANTGRSSSF